MSLYDKLLKQPKFLMDVYRVSLISPFSYPTDYHTEEIAIEYITFCPSIQDINILFGYEGLTGISLWAARQKNPVFKHMIVRVK